MGMFDRIMFRCSCGEEIEAQSKSGGCSLATYGCGEVPEDVAEDANRHAPFVCRKCGRHWELRRVEPPKKVTLVPVEV